MLRDLPRGNLYHQSEFAPFIGALTRILFEEIAELKMNHAAMRAVCLRHELISERELSTKYVQSAQTLDPVVLLGWG